MAVERCRHVDRWAKRWINVTKRHHLMPLLQPLGNISTHLHPGETYIFWMSAWMLLCKRKRVPSFPLETWIAVERKGEKAEGNIGVKMDSSSAGICKALFFIFTSFAVLYGVVLSVEVFNSLPQWCHFGKGGVFWIDSTFILDHTIQRIIFCSKRWLICD